MINQTHIFAMHSLRDRAIAVGYAGHILPIGLENVGTDGLLLVAFTHEAQGISVPISRGRPPTV